MKKLLFLGVGSALMFTMGGVGPAQADTFGNDTHKSTSIAGNTGAQLVSPGGGRCASCHRAHTAKAEMLLQESQPALCYSCHGGGAGTYLDVVDGVDPNDSAKALRGGGFAYAKIDGGAGAKLSVGPIDPATGRNTFKTGTVDPLTVAAPVTSRHQIDGTTSGTVWGNGAISSEVNPGKAGVVLECGSCHDPHGNGNYRILKKVPNPSDAPAVSILVKAEVPAVLNPDGTVHVLAVPAVMSPADGVDIPDATGERVYTTSNYWNVTDRSVPTVTNGTLPLAANVTDGYIANVSQWCSTCHTRYLAQAPAYETKSGDAVFTYRHTSNRIDKAGVGRPNCIQCHVSHGTNVAMGGDAAAFTAPDGQVPTAKGTAGVGAYPKAPGATGAVIGNSRLLRVDDRGTCQMCHNK